jgi:hypothetical protein
MLFPADDEGLRGPSGAQPPRWRDLHSSLGSRGRDESGLSGVPVRHPTYVQASQCHCAVFVAPQRRAHAGVVFELSGALAAPAISGCARSDRSPVIRSRARSLRAGYALGHDPGGACERKGEEELAPVGAESRVRSDRGNPDE